ncbi:MlaD family protein [Thermodesulfobacteriota bacterium]
MAEKEHRSRIHYIHTLSYSSRERLVGLFMLVAFGIIIALIISRGKASNLFEERVSYHAYLKNAQGISTDSAITISGIDVGSVESIDITPENSIHVGFFVYKKYQDLLRNDSTGSLSKLSLLGNVLLSNTVLTIKAGSPDLPILEDGSVVPFEEPKTIDTLIAEFTPIIDNVMRTLENLSKVIASIDPEKIKTTTTELVETMNNIRSATDHIAGGKGGIGKLLYDEDLENDLSRTMANIRNTTDHITRGEGALGKVIYDKDFEQDMGQTIALLKVAVMEAERRIKEVKLVIDNATSITEDLKTTSKSLDQEMMELPILINRLKLLMESTDETLQGLQRVWPLSSAIKAGEESLDIEEKPYYD